MPSICCNAHARAGRKVCFGLRGDYYKLGAAARCTTRGAPRPTNNTRRIGQNHQISQGALSPCGHMRRAAARQIKCRLPSPAVEATHTQTSNPSWPSRSRGLVSVATHKHPSRGTSHHTQTSIPRHITRTQCLSLSLEREQQRQLAMPDTFQNSLRRGQSTPPALGTAT